MSECGTDDSPLRRNTSVKGPKLRILGANFWNLHLFDAVKDGTCRRMLEAISHCWMAGTAVEKRSGILVWISLHRPFCSLYLQTPTAKEILSQRRVHVHMCLKRCSLGMTNLAVSASLLAWSFNPHICMAKHRSASTHPVVECIVNACFDCAFKMLF